MPSWLTAIFTLVPEALTEFEAIESSPAVQDVIALGKKYLVHTTTATGTTVAVEPKATTTTGS